MEFAPEMIEIGDVKYTVDNICEMAIPDLNQLIFNANVTQTKRMEIKKRRKHYKITKASLKQQINRLEDDLDELHKEKMELEKEKLQYKREILFYTTQLRRANTNYY